ncbi:hypothetical protein ACH5RR_002813 [Cinchona calisaya]|uniref:Uncharacterized protein n=1 Tax=Cinchona calisaya TaxID=153742 RepID=A0ABD3AT06_9GENT
MGEETQEEGDKERKWQGMGRDARERSKEGAAGGGKGRGEVGRVGGMGWVSQEGWEIRGGEHSGRRRDNRCGGRK